MVISRLNDSSLDMISLLAKKLWEDADLKELKDHYHEILYSEDQVCFLMHPDQPDLLVGTKERNSQSTVSVVGFIEVSTRYDYVEGCEHSPVAYIEGIYIDWEHRGKGLAKQLVEAAVNWAKEKGYQEMGSDCELTNEASIKFHTSSSIGFSEANRIVSFVRVL